MKRILLISIIIASLCTILNPSVKATEIVTRSIMGCLTEADIKEFYEQARNDKEHMMALVNEKRCVPIEGLKFAIVANHYPYSLIRIFTENGSVKVWTLYSVQVME